MTTIEILRQNNHIKKIKSFGHCGYAKEGEDIVCSALSSIIQTALLGLLRYAQINVDYKIDDQNAKLTFELPLLDAHQTKDADAILETMVLGIKDLYENYSDFISLIEK